MIISKPTAKERFFASVLRHYALKSGCGTVANSKLVKFLIGERDVNLWSNILGRPAVVPLNDLVGRSMYLMGDLDRRCPP